MTFNLQLYPRTEFKTVKIAEGRFYDTPVGLLPSVTNVLSRDKKKKEVLRKWRERVGDKEADAVVKQSRTKGNSLHSICEKYLANDDSWKDGLFAVNLVNAKQVLKILDINVVNVYGLELLVWSEKLKLAGRTDALVSFQSGYKHIMDFKTSRWPVNLDSDKLHSYKLQTTMYAMMAEDQYMTDIPFCSIIVAQKNLEPILVNFKNDELRDEARQLILA